MKAKPKPIVCEIVAAGDPPLMTLFPVFDPLLRRRTIEPEVRVITSEPEEAKPFRPYWDAEDTM